MDKTEKLRAVWSLYFSNNNINPTKTEDLSSFHITNAESIFFIFQLDDKKELVISNSAIYFQDVRWSLSNICKFAIYQSNSKIYLANATGTVYCIKFLNNTDSDIFLSRIISMQEYWLYAATNGSKQRTELFNHANIALKDSINSSCIVQEEILYISQFLLKYTSFRKEIGLTLIEYRLSRGDFNSLLRCLPYLSPEIDDNTLFHYVENLLRKHKPVNILINNNIFQEDSQPEIVRRISKTLVDYANISSLKDKINNKNIRSYRDLLEELCDSPDANKEEYIKLWYKTMDASLQIARESIIAQSSLNASTLECIDNYGMYLFNYAVLFNNKSVLSLYDSLNLKAFVSDEASPINAIFDPLFIAYFRSDLDTFNYLVTRSSDFIALGKTLTTIRDRLQAVKTASSNPFDHAESIRILNDIKAQENYIAKLKATRIKNKIPWHTIREAEAKADSLKDRYNRVLAMEKHKATDKRRDCYSQLKEEEQIVIEEIERLKDYYKNKYEKYVQYFNESEDAFINMMLFSYLNPEKFYKQALNNCCAIVYSFNNLFLVNSDYFSMFKNIHKQKSQTEQNRGESSQHQNDQKQSRDQSKEQYNQSQQRKQQQKSSRNNNQQSSSTFKEEPKISSVKKPYGNSWFSPEAHKDLSVLKHEYRKLIFKYHPDSPEGSAEIFIDIQNERNSIISKIGR